MLPTMKRSLNPTAEPGTNVSTAAGVEPEVSDGEELDEPSDMGLPEDPSAGGQSKVDAQPAVRAADHTRSGKNRMPEH